MKLNISTLSACLIVTLMSATSADAQSLPTEYSGTLTYSVRYDASDFFSGGKAREDVRAQRGDVVYQVLGQDKYLTIYVGQYNTSSIAGQARTGLTFAAYVRDEHRERYLNGKKIRFGYESIEMTYTCQPIEPSSTAYTKTEKITKIHGDDWNANSYKTQDGKRRMTRLVDSRSPCNHGYISQATITINYFVKKTDT